MSQQPEEQPAVLRVGVVGVGWAGRQHLKAYRDLDGVELVAVAGMEEDLVRDLKAEHGIPFSFSRWEDFIDFEGMDAISIALPTFLHAEVAVAAFERGLHVLSEKPLARNSQEGLVMVEAARKAHRVLDVAFNHRRRGDIAQLKNLIDTGELGRPYYAKGSWIRRAGIPMLGSWFTSHELAGGGPLTDIGVHVLDYSLHLLGEPRVLSVSAATHSELGPRGLGGNARYSAMKSSHTFEVEDFAAAFMRLDGGGTLILEAGWAAYREEDDLLDFMVYGTDGGAELRALGTPSAPVGDLRIFKEKDGENADYLVVAEPGRGHHSVIQDFVDAVRGGPAVWREHDGSLALSRARVLDACYQSARERREVTL